MNDFTNADAAVPLPPRSGGEGSGVGENSAQQKAPPTPTLPAARKSSRGEGKNACAAKFEHRITSIAEKMLDRVNDVLDVFAAEEARKRALVRQLLCTARACKRAQACRHAPCTALSEADTTLALQMLRACVRRRR